MGPGGSDEFGYTVFAEVIGGWEKTVERITEQERAGKEGFARDIPFRARLAKVFVNSRGELITPGGV